jgi:hypothetical protein
MQCQNCCYGRDCLPDFKKLCTLRDSVKDKSLEFSSTYPLYQVKALIEAAKNIIEHTTEPIRPRILCVELQKALGPFEEVKNE